MISGCMDDERGKDCERGRKDCERAKNNVATYIEKQQDPAIAGP